MVTLNRACGLQAQRSLTCVAIDGATWDSRVISCAEEHGYDCVVEWARENGCPEP
jgi:hypothetical protein